jgi:hypothetical protein|tara:strand:- start:138 stop:266 length:129 start_codon:yes stop_codon:yes gene_type:complete
MFLLFFDTWSKGVLGKILIHGIYGLVFADGWFGLLSIVCGSE